MAATVNQTTWMTEAMGTDGDFRDTINIIHNFDQTNQPHSKSHLSCIQLLLTTPSPATSVFSSNTQSFKFVGARELFIGLDSDVVLTK